MNNDRTTDLTRRKVLAGLGGIGVASAGAALGTSAYFSDEESFEGNTLAAGELDLKVDWEEHYSYPQLYGFDDPTTGLDYEILDAEPEEGDYVGFPDPEQPQIWIHESDIATYMANTAIEAFPDPDDDGQQEMQEGDNFSYQPCEHGADLPQHLEPDPQGYGRIRNDGTYDSEAEEYRPLVSLEDVKPGDFGEFTLSFHLCDNPGYVWLQADNVSEAENDLTEPEAAVDDSPEDPELAENIQTAWWYDTNGNNVVDSAVGEVDVMIAVDTSGSLSEFGEGVEPLEDAANDLAQSLDAQADARIGGLTFADSVDDFTSLADGPVAFSGLTSGGGTAMPAALEIAAAELDANGRPDAETFVVLLTDGGPNYETGIEHNLGGHTAGPYSGGSTNWNVVEDGELDETAGIADDIRDDHRILTVGINDDRAPEGRSVGDAGLLSTYLRDEIAGVAADYFSADDPNTVSNLLDAIIDAIAVPEDVFHRGTLAEDLEDLAQDDGIPLDGSLSTEGTECFEPGVNYFIGFAWWLPTDVGNEIQGDSVGFDLGFYTEQCRNNEGPNPTEET